MVANFSFPKKKIPVGIIGATGTVGQKLIELLAEHPWFEISALAASERSSGNSYKDAVNWLMQKPIPHQIMNMKVQQCKPDLPCKIIFSSLDANVAGDIEVEFAKAGYIVLSNSKNHRLDTDVPLLVPEINSNHLDIIKYQPSNNGFIVTNPNCSVIGLVLALKPLLDNFGLETVNVVTLQALSGAGYPGIASLEILDNVIPYIGGEEEKMEQEPLKILGKYKNGTIHNIDLAISAQCNRVAVIDGHLECVSVKLKTITSVADIKQTWRTFAAEPQKLKLPMAPEKPIHYFEGEKFPQPKLHRNIDKGMAVSIGRLRECNVLDYKFVVLSHNTIRGAAGSTILNAELLVKRGLLPNL